MKKFLQTKKTQIIDGQSKPIMLKGVNVGGWLMMEAYILYAPNRAEQLFKKQFKEALGEKVLKEFEDVFRSSFITQEDFKNIKSLGLNCIRVPFNHRLVEPTPYRYDEDGLKYLDQVLVWASRHKIYVILDLHGAAGAQNYDWHSDSLGKAELWTNKDYQKQTFALWEFLADRYKNEAHLVGYDILNEAVLEDNKLLNDFYKQTIKSIRQSDKNHILFIEGNRWAQDLAVLDKFDDGNYVLSLHNYEPPNFSFHLITHLHYPLKTKEEQWNKSIMHKHLEKSKVVADRHGVPLFVGEFGINAREGHYGEDKWLNDTLKCYQNFGFHWTYWTYKAIKNCCHPDGLYSYRANPPWVNRAGPLMGWETYHLHWPTRKNEMAESWLTKNFTPNAELIKIIKKYAK